MFLTKKIDSKIVTNEKEILLEKYDKEFGLEIGSNKELVENMTEDSVSLFEEMENEYSIATKYFMNTLEYFFYGLRPHDDRDIENNTIHGNADADAEQEHKIRDNINSTSCSSESWSFSRIGNLEYFVSQFSQLFTKKKEN